MKSVQWFEQSDWRASWWSRGKGWDDSFVDKYFDLSPYSLGPRLPSTWYHPQLLA